MSKKKSIQQFWERSKTPGFNNILGYADKPNCQSKKTTIKPIRLVKINNKYETFS